MRLWHRLFYPGVTLILALLATGARAESPRVLIAFMESSYYLPTRVICDVMRPGVKTLSLPGTPSFSNATYLPCANSVQSALATQSARLSVTPPVPGGPAQVADALIQLKLESSASATRSNAFAGLYRMELGGATGRWRLSNMTQRTALAVLSCQLDFSMIGSAQHPVPGVGNVLADGSVRLLAPFTDVLVADLCPMPPDPVPAYVKLTGTRKVCFGPFSTIDLKIEGRALAKADGGYVFQTSNSAASNVTVQYANVQAAPGPRGEIMYAECNAPPGEIVVLAPVTP
jgi:hypothetical protein